MDRKNHFSRRKFLQQTSIGLGAAITGTTLTSMKATIGESQISPSEISVFTIDLRGLWGEPKESRIKKVLSRVGELSGFKPDIVCLPELFDVLRTEEKYNIKEIAEDEKNPGFVGSQLAKFAVSHKCYVTCPIYTKKDGRFFNSSILFNPKGTISGVYNKIHPSAQEISRGISAGKMNQPVHNTEFGKIGMQIGEDAYWSDGWDTLKKERANIIFYSSGFSGGRILNHYALRNNCYIISSTANDGRIINISGDDLHSTSTFIRYGWANINPEKRNMSHLPDNGMLGKLFNKYGKKVEVKIWDNNWVATIESHDPDLKIMDVMKEFKIQEIDEFYMKAEAAQKKYRP